MAKERADVLCVSQGLFESREKAKRAIMAGIVYNDNIEKRFEVTKEIKKQLKKLVPEYMVPKKIVFLEEMPLNNNGKIDKKKLKELV